MDDEALLLECITIDPDLGTPDREVGNSFCTFGIAAGIGTGGSGHTAITLRPLPDRPKSAWPTVFYDEMAGRGTTLGPNDAWVSGYLVHRRGSLDLEELANNREAVLACGEAWDDPHVERVLDALLAEVPAAELLGLLDANLARAERLGRGGSAAEWVEIAAADPTWNLPLLRAFEKDPGQAEGLLRRHLAFDVASPTRTAKLAAKALHAAGATASPVWRVAEAAVEGASLSKAYLAAAQDLEDTDPLGALVLAANAITLARTETEAWPDGAWELIVRCGAHAHPDYQAFLEEL